MVDYPSLQNISVCEAAGEGATLCEVSGVLLSEMPPRVQQLISAHPSCHQTHKQSEMRPAGARTDPASLFLTRAEAPGPEVGSVTSLLSLLLQGGLEGVLNNVSSAVGRGLANFWQLVWSFRSSIYPHLKLSPAELVAEHSNTRSWSSAHIRCVAWHPHTAKLAVAYRDDSISVVTVAGQATSATQPVLKHAAMRSVSMMAWRPLSSSQLAVACQAGVAVWTVDPSSLVSRPSSSCLVRLVRPGHAPVTQVQWSGCGRLLASSCPADTRVHVWSVEAGQCDTVSRAGGGGAALLRWSRDSKRLLVASPGAVFRVWDTLAAAWTADRWTVGGGRGRVAAAAWSPDSGHLLFATTEEAVLYCVSFRGQGEAAVPLMDLSRVELEGGGAGGGLVQDIVWDNTGHRVAVTFRHTSAVCLLRTKPGQARLSPIGWVVGSGPEEVPLCAQFQGAGAEWGAVLTVVWSSGRVQHLPLVFSITEDLLAELPDTPVQELFTQY